MKSLSEFGPSCEFEERSEKIGGKFKLQQGREGTDLETSNSNREVREMAGNLKLQQRSKGNCGRPHTPAEK
jgi:hypothetical protein